MLTGGLPVPLELEKWSFGVGDRFAQEAGAQLRAFQRLADDGVEVIPVWNKSDREHRIIGSEPISVRHAAEAAVAREGWKAPYHIDADHINLDTVDRFLEASDFYTIDVADCIGRPTSDGAIQGFLAGHGEWTGEVPIAGLERPLRARREELEAMAGRYLAAVSEAGRIYRYIANHRGEENVIIEVSMDETELPQSPMELLVILAALADEGVPLQTIAPKFSGRFNKGVDYEGSLEVFESEFRADLGIIAHAIEAYDLPENLKLSVHSGSDKFSLYPVIRRALRERDAGIHVKTAGTTWLEEVIGLAEAGGEALALAKEIYGEALAHRESLCAPYASVIAIDPARLPEKKEVEGWDSQTFVGALRHDPSAAGYRPDFRQLLHVGFKVAASMGPRYIQAVGAHAEVIGAQVTENLYRRHLRPLFLD